MNTRTYIELIEVETCTPEFRRVDDPKHIAQLSKMKGEIVSSPEGTLYEIVDLIVIRDECKH